MLLGLNLAAQSLLPLDAGTSVNGFQDDFSGSVLGPKWVVSGANVYSVGGGVLHVATVAGDPNHLLCELPGYDNTVQEVLARIRVLDFGSGRRVPGGVAVAVNPASNLGIRSIPLKWQHSERVGQPTLHAGRLRVLGA